jgi:hypothetical protein
LQFFKTLPRFFLLLLHQFLVDLLFRFSLGVKTPGNRFLYFFSRRLESNISDFTFNLLVELLFPFLVLARTDPIAEPTICFCSWFWSFFLGLDLLKEILSLWVVFVIVHLNLIVIIAKLKDSLITGSQLVAKVRHCLIAFI